jgi:hypothetical protein
MMRGGGKKLEKTTKKEGQAFIAGRNRNAPSRPRVEGRWKGEAA